MSKSGYNTYCNGRIIELEDQLAKANERVKELEHGNRACAIAIRGLIARGDGDIEPLMIGNEALDKIVNKFAIEKRIEGAYAVISLLDETKDSKAILMANKYVREQLRKEQE